MYPIWTCLVVLALAGVAVQARMSSDLGRLYRWGLPVGENCPRALDIGDLRTLIRVGEYNYREIPIA